MQIDNSQQEIVMESMSHIGPILAGTAVSMLFQKGAWPRRLAQIIIGIPFAIYMSPFVDRMFDQINWAITETEAGVLTGVFGITIVAYCYEVLAQLHIGTLLHEKLRKVLKLEKKAEE